MGTCLFTYTASPSVPHTRHWPSTSKLFTDRVWLGSIWVVSRWPLPESPASQALMIDWFPPAGAIALRDIMLVLRPPIGRNRERVNIYISLTTPKWYSTLSTLRESNRFFVLLHTHRWSHDIHSEYTHWYSLCMKEGVSELLEVSQCSSEPSSEHVNKWSGLEGWKWTSHTVKIAVKVCECVNPQMLHIYIQIHVINVYRKLTSKVTKNRKETSANLTNFLT